jgi:Protein of unknown function (DUF4050)
MTANKQNQAAVREINRMLLQSVRNDWSYPDTPSLPSTRITEAVKYQERYYSTSDGSSSESLDDEEEEGEESNEEDPDVDLKDIKFESPDSVGEFINRKIQAHKRKKRKQVEEEMRWNDGLCFFMRRRNAWTGALSPDEVQARHAAKDTGLPTLEAVIVDDDKPTSESTQESDASSPHSAEPTTDDQTTQETKDSKPQPPPDTDSGISIPAPDQTITETPFTAPPDPSTLHNVLLPVAPPLLPPTHQVRSSIMSRSDSELYEKVVRDSRTPAVPINLAHMMRVVVQGWKDEGNWPPKSSAVTSNIVLADTASTRATGGGGLLSGHKHLRQGVESVRRVLRLSGSAPPPGD